MGYAYFKNKDYQNAVSWFRRYLNLTGGRTRMVGDALNRIGDSYFIMTQYPNAIEYYDSSIANQWQIRIMPFSRKLLHRD
jgi:tetratricopeptide (TPR) repeat protein